MATCADLKTEGDHKWIHISTELSLFLPPEDHFNKLPMEVRTVQYKCSACDCSAEREIKIRVNQSGDV